MSETRTVSLGQLVRANNGQGPYPLPLCPACVGGHLHPYRVSIRVNFEDAEWIDGWVAVCVGNEEHKRQQARAYGLKVDDPGSRDYVPDVHPCGFSMPMTPHRSGHRPH